MRTVRNDKFDGVVQTAGDRVVIGRKKRSEILFTTIRLYKMRTPRLDEEVLERVEREFASLLREISGFHAYRLIDSGNYGIASISLFETEAGAEESIERAREWVEANLAHLIDGPPTVFRGEQVFSELV